MRLDLHLHTSLSDGDLTPEALVSEAAAADLDVISVTDHDTAAGVLRARSAAEGTGLLVIPGVELSSTHDEREVHVLGYGVDPRSDAVVDHGTMAHHLRRARMEAMLERLGAQGIEVSLDEVRQAAGSAATMMGRPHLARVLVDRGFADSVPQAFDTLIGDQHPAFVPTRLGTPLEAVATVRAAGGLPVWAHPPMELVDALLPSMVEAGLGGLEAYRPGWPARRSRQLATRARSLGLCVTGGSDYHGPGRNGNLGEFWVKETLVRGFLEELGLDLA